MSTLAHVTALFLIPGPKIASVGLDFERTVDYDVAALTGLANAAYAGWTGSPNLQDRFPTAVAMRAAQAYAFDVVPATVPAGQPPRNKRELTLGPVSSVVADVAGTQIGEPVLPQVATVVTHRTAISQRTKRGRVYLPPINDAFVDDAGMLDPAFMAALQTSYNDWVIGIADGDPIPAASEHVVVTLKAGEADDAEPVTQRIVRSRIDTQRRRLTRESV